MRLDERNWICAGGATPEWRWVARRRVTESLSRLGAVAKAFPRLAPPAVSRAGYLRGLRYFLRQGGSGRDALCAHPGLDYWLFLWDRHFGMPVSLPDWHLQMGLFQGFAAWLAVLRRDRADFDSVLDPDARLHFYGSPFYLEYPKGSAQKPVRIRVRGDRLEVLGPGRVKVRATLEELGGLSASGASQGPVRLFRSPEIIPGMAVEDKAWLLRHGVTVHGLARPDAKGLERFVSVLKSALSEMSRGDPELAVELCDMVRLIVPLENPLKLGSVSSSYVNMRGAICLSHAEDPLLQAETLIHEFCHQKMNQLMVVEPILLAGQSGQVFYSPWRKDPRRLRGLLLGAHAFLNVSRHLLGCLSRDSFRRKEGLDIMLNVALRLYQVEAALRTLAFYGSFTEFGRRFVLGMSRELGVLFHAAQWFPRGLLKEARDKCLEHKAEFSLLDTGLYKGGLVDRVRRAPFLDPGSLKEAGALGVGTEKMP